MDMPQQRPGSHHMRQWLALEFEVVQVGEQLQAGDPALLDECLTLGQAGEDIGLALVEVLERQRDTGLASLVGSQGQRRRELVECLRARHTLGNTPGRAAETFER
jgi:hypothetical protein